MKVALVHDYVNVLLLLEVLIVCFINQKFTFACKFMSFSGVSSLNIVSGGNGGKREDN